MSNPGDWSLSVLDVSVIPSRTETSRSGGDLLPESGAQDIHKAEIRLILQRYRSLPAFAPHFDPTRNREASGIVSEVGEPR